MNPNEIIDGLGGTTAVADICDRTKGAVSQWRKSGIPSGFQKYLMPLYFKQMRRQKRENSEKKAA